MEKRITLPLTEELARTLHAGDTVLLTGTIYTSRDAGHAGILTDGNILPVSDLIVFNDIVQHALGDAAILTGTAGLNGALYISGQMGIGLDTQPFHHIRNGGHLNLTHSQFLLIIQGSFR